MYCELVVRWPDSSPPSLPPTIARTRESEAIDQGGGGGGDEKREGGGGVKKVEVRTLSIVGVLYRLRFGCTVLNGNGAYFSLVGMTSNLLPMW